MIKMKKIILVFTISILLQFTIEGNGDRIKDKMYENIPSRSACYRRLNGTHQIGCSSKRGGSTGIIHFCETDKDLEEIISNGTGYPYIPILPFKLFTPPILHTMINSNKISGLILHTNNETLTNFTHENKCPNPYSSIEGTCRKESTWNPWGTNLLYTDIPFPVFYVESTEDVKLIKDCFAKFNNFSYQEHADRSLCSLELNSFMYATTNTPTCIRRSSIISNLNPQKFCDPLGGNNVWASLHPLAEGPRRNETKPIKDYKYIVVAARLDTTSMFEKTFGASSPATGIVTLLSLAKFLNDTVKLEDVKAAKKNVLFILFNGESYDYIGSQRIFFDMSNGNFPLDLADNKDILPIISPKDIDLFVEISQLGNVNEKLYVHHLNEEPLSAINFINRLKKYNPNFEGVSKSLPPSSLHTFMKNISTFPGLLISDHRTAYSNHFYNSIYDNSSNINFKYYNVSLEEVGEIPFDSLQYLIKNVTDAVGKSIFEEITGSVYNGHVEADVVLVNELLYCYLENYNCKVHHGLPNLLKKFPNIPYSLYVGVKDGNQIATTITGLTLGWLTGNYVGPSDANCINKPKNYAFRYYNMSKSIYDLNVTMCFQVTMDHTEAVSPAFSIKDYDWSSGQYSSWSESTWKDINVRIFLKPSASQGKMSVAIGCITLIFSFILVYFIKSRSHILFAPPVPTEAPTDC